MTGKAQLSTAAPPSFSAWKAVHKAWLRSRLCCGVAAVSVLDWAGLGDLIRGDNVSQKSCLTERSLQKLAQNSEACLDKQWIRLEMSHFFQPSSTCFNFHLMHVMQCVMQCVIQWNRLAMLDLSDSRHLVHQDRQATTWIRSHPEPSGVVTEFRGQSP